MGFLDLFRRKAWDPGEDSTIRFTARTRFISHAIETLGEPSDEFSVKVDSPGIQDMLILEFPASQPRLRLRSFRPINRASAHHHVNVPATAPPRSENRRVK
jgi:hypothetical protein